MTKPLILATGFDVFPGAPENPTAWAIGALAQRNWQPAAARLETAVLPVTFDMWERHALPLIRALKPMAVIAFGLSAKTTGFTLESTARNAIAMDRPDFSGQCALDDCVSRAGPPFHPSGLPLTEIAKALHRAGLPIVRSDDAGDYLCNMLFYQLMHTATETGIRSAGFIHVPYLTSQIERLRSQGREIAHGASLDESLMMSGVKTIIETCAVHLAPSASGHLA